jgi:hypothetical protein
MHTRNTTDVADAPPSPSIAIRTRSKTNTTNNGKPTAGPKTTGLSDDENADDVSDNEEVEEDVGTTKKTNNVLLSLIMDMCQPLFGSGRVVNMDNYYTSPMAAWMLSQEKVYMRGTCRTNRIGIPGGIGFSSSEKNRYGRGTMKVMIEKSKRIAAFGWLDGNPVHFISTADGTAVSSVKRRVGRDLKTIEAPIGIRNYNAGMQAVDRHDQLREGFSLSARHGFKKYYQKIALGLIDMAVVNAWIHYKLVNPEKCSHERARYEFMESLANSLLDTNWQEYNQNEITGTSDDVLRLLTQEKRQGFRKKTMDVDDPTGDETIDDDMISKYHCTPIAVQELMLGKRSKKRGLSCQVCSFEGRGWNIIKNVVACSQHRVRACLINHEDRDLKKEDGSDVTDYTWRAAMPGASCWDKVHKFYIPNGLFRDDVPIFTGDDDKILFQCCCVGSKLYKKKRIALGKNPSFRGRKRLNMNEDSKIDKPDENT